MKSKIKLSDLPVLIKSDRRYQVALVLLLLIILWPLLVPSKPARRQQQARQLQEPTGTGRTPESELGEDLVKVFKADLENVNQKVDNIEKTVQSQGENLKHFENRTAEIFKKVLERVAENETRAVPASVSPTDIPGADGLPAVDSEKLDRFGDDEKEVVPPAPPPPQKIAMIGPGDTVRVKLLAGVTAPTDGTPYPVLFKLVDDVYGPDGSQLPLGEARLIAAAQGSLTDSRALFRLTSLSVRLPNGRRKVVGVDGWIVGEDGIRGMPGVLIDPIGKAIAGAGMAGALQGIGDGFAQSQTTTSFGYGQQSSAVTGDVAKYAAGRGASRAADAWSDIIQQRLSELVPVVEVLSGRESTAIFASSVTIPDLYEALEEDTEGFQFASLD